MKSCCRYLGLNSSKGFHFALETEEVFFYPLVNEGYFSTCRGGNYSDRRACLISLLDDLIWLIACDAWMALYWFAKADELFLAGLLFLSFEVKFLSYFLFRACYWCSFNILSCCKSSLEVILRPLAPKVSLAIFMCDCFFSMALCGPVVFTFYTCLDSSDARWAPFCLLCKSPS